MSASPGSFNISMTICRQYLMLANISYGHCIRINIGIHLWEERKFSLCYYTDSCHCSAIPCHGQKNGSIIWAHIDRECKEEVLVICPRYDHRKITWFSFIAVLLILWMSINKRTVSPEPSFSDSVKKRYMCIWSSIIYYIILTKKHYKLSWTSIFIM